MVLNFFDTLFDTKGKKKQKIRTAIIKCPKCGHKNEEKIPTSLWQYFYVCLKCQFELKPKEGECCVFCSYGSVKCMPKQIRDNL